MAETNLYKEYGCLTKVFAIDNDVEKDQTTSILLVEVNEKQKRGADTTSQIMNLYFVSLVQQGRRDKLKLACNLVSCLAQLDYWIHRDQRKWPCSQTQTISFPQRPAPWEPCCSFATAQPLQTRKRAWCQCRYSHEHLWVSNQLTGIEKLH